MRGVRVGPGPDPGRGAGPWAVDALCGARPSSALEFRPVAEERDPSDPEADVLADLGLPLFVLVLIAALAVVVGLGLSDTRRRP